MKKTALYIHIPFCDHKCIYCDFYSITKLTDKKKYLNALLNEIKYFADKFAKDRIISSIFFGGGTPSFMEPEFIGAIISAVQKKFCVANNAEITLETNPGTVDKNKISGFADAGINRVSIGIQSFDDEELRFLTRIHNKDQAITTVNAVASAGIDNISLDLIFNLPNQTKYGWKNNLEIAASLPIKHISAYSLILERGTILNKMVLDGKVKFSDEDYDADLYEMTIEYLSGKSFFQYEVSNFAKSGYECKHNNSYWHYDDYLSFGPSAHSFMEKVRWWNYSGLTLYIDSVSKIGHAKRNEEKLSDTEMLNEYIMLALRSSGIDLNQLEKRFGKCWIDKNSKTLSVFVNDGLLIKDECLFKLTPKGYAVCDEMLLHFK